MKRIEKLNKKLNDKIMEAIIWFGVFLTAVTCTMLVKAPGFIFTVALAMMFYSAIIFIRRLFVCVILDEQIRDEER